VGEGGVRGDIKSVRKMPIKVILSISVLLLFWNVATCAPLAGKAPQNVADRFLPDGDGIKVEVWIENLEIPWSLLFLHDGRALVSERPGRIRLIRDGKIRESP